jgi:N-acetylneuraminate synthase
MTNIIAEIGINHNGSMELCKDLIHLSKISGVKYVKIQKRNPDVCVPEEQKNVTRKTPWGEMTYLDYKKKIEFSEEQIKELVEYSSNLGLTFFASVWDLDSVKVMAKYTKIAKIPSALITDVELCKAAHDAFDTLIISTGMSSEQEIERCIDVCTPDVIMHTNSTYPCPVEELNLRYIEHLKNKWGDRAEIGYSGHEYGIVTTFAAVAMGATWIERHITLDQNMWGSDHKSSVNPEGLIKLVRGVKSINDAMKYEPGPRIEFESELLIKKSLRK